MEQHPLRKTIYIALALLTLSTLAYEILLTRTFSVTTLYHYAFLIVSISMFGLAAGALIVYRMPRNLTEDRIVQLMARNTFGFAVSVPLSYLTHLAIPFPFHFSLVGIFAIMLNCFVISIPFIFSGVAVCLALSRLKGNIGKLYAADLGGAGLGCMFVLVIMEVMDGPTAVIAAAFIGALSAWFFTFSFQGGRLKKFTLATCVVLGLFVAVNSVLAQNQQSLLRLLWVKGGVERGVLYEKWNTFSRIIVQRKHRTKRSAFGWGLSPRFKMDIRSIDHLWILIDSSAGTVMTNFKHNKEQLKFLKLDVANTAHHLRRNADVFVIGVGGGRDFLSSLAFKQKSVLGAEINKNILKVIHEKYGDFTGHLDRYKQFTFVNDEARSFITRQDKKFDIIQSSLIDTWAATAAGAFVLTENALYTADAWQVFLEHLKPNGILTFSRFWTQGQPDEAYRMVSLANAALKKIGVTDPQAHIVLVRLSGVGTIMVSPSPFSEEDLAKLDELRMSNKMNIIVSPKEAVDKTVRRLASSDPFLDQVYDSYPVNIRPPTDNKPFFFNMVRLQNIFDKQQWMRGGNRRNAMAFFVLGVLLVTVTIMALMVLLAPLTMGTPLRDLQSNWHLLLFFAAIGLGFMILEIAMMQRLIIFLGHPTYGLSVILFILLIAGGIGSFLIGARPEVQRMAKPPVLATVALAIFVIIGLIQQPVLGMYRGEMTILRVLVAVLLLSPMGICMGMFFPLGMNLAKTKAPALAAWFWGINGAMSIVASVLAVIISLEFGITNTFWVGVECYVVACLAYSLAHSSSPKLSHSR